MSGDNGNNGIWKDAWEREPQKFFGKLSVDPYYVALIKGQGKVVYDPVTHASLRKHTLINFTVTPLDPTAKLIGRECLNWTAEYTQAIRPSIEVLRDQIAAIRGQATAAVNPLQAANGLFVAGEFVPRPDNKPGETWTTLRFTAVFADEAACQAAATASAPPPAPAVPDSAARQSLAMFLPALWEQAGRNAQTLAGLLATHAVLFCFTMSDPEVVAVMQTTPAEV